MKLPRCLLLKQQSRNIIVATCLLVALLTTAHAQRRSDKPAAATSASRFGNSDYLTTAQLRDYLRFIASDEMEGRDTPSRGLDITANFIATNLSRLGLKPAGDEGTFFQRIALRHYKLDPAQTHVQINNQRFKFGEDFLSLMSAGTTEGPLVYVGHGWAIKAKNIDAYQGVDVKDKIMVVLGIGLPRGTTFADLSRGEQGVDWDHPYGYAQRHGAKGVIMIPNYRTLTNWKENSLTPVERGSVFVMQPDQKEGTFSSFVSYDGPVGTFGLLMTEGLRLPVVTISVAMLNALFQGEKENPLEIFKRIVSLDPGQPFDFTPTKRVSFKVGLSSEQQRAQNIAAVLEGSDPVLKNEYVVVGAHYDHLGLRTPVNGDTTYNGADDNGSGAAALLALADAFARGPRPKRSVLFAWYCGEEKGNWGSRYMLEHPVVPVDRIVTQINLDMIGRTKKEGDTNPRNHWLTGPNEIHVIGSSMLSTQLGDLVETVNKSYLNLTFNYAGDDPKSGFSFSSDHAEYGRKGIPFVWYFSGFHEDYHRVTDSADKIDYEKMGRVARTVCATAWVLANTPNRPLVDKRLPTELSR
jgi:hypothetical protein